MGKIAIVVLMKMFIHSGKRIFKFKIQSSPIQKRTQTKTVQGARQNTDRLVTKMIHEK
jgi:hypothetical protein